MIWKKGIMSNQVTRKQKCEFPLCNSTIVCLILFSRHYTWYEIISRNWCILRIKMKVRVPIYIYIYIYIETWCHCQRLYRSVWELTSCFLFPRSFLVLYRHGPFKDCTNYIELSNLSKSCFTWVIVKDCPTKPKDSTLNCFSFHPNTECHWITN